MMTFFNDAQNLVSIASALFGAGGLIYGWKKRKLSNFDKLQEIYSKMIDHYDKLIQELNNKNKKDE